LYPILVTFPIIESVINSFLKDKDTVLCMPDLRCVRIRPVNVEIFIPQVLKHLINGIGKVNVTGITVGECLNDLVRQFPQLRIQIFETNGDLKGYLEVFVNDKSAYPDELAKPIRNGDRIMIINIIEGG
jgi:molybdopterin converting factor small subunit